VSQEWYYVQGGQQVGPVSFEQLRDMGARSQIGRNDLVWCEGMGDWQPAGEVEGLLALAPPGAPGVGRMGGGRGRAGVRGRGGAGAGRQAGVGSRRGGGRNRYSRRPTGTPSGVMTGFILALIGIVICAPLGIVGMILCIGGYGEAKRAGGVGFAIAGIILGGLCALALLVVVLALAVGGGSY